MPDLATIATLVGVIAGVAVSVAVIAKSPFLGKPIHWLWRTNVSQPIGEWNRGIVGDVVDARVEHLLSSRDGEPSPLLDLADSVRSIDSRMGRVEEHLVTEAHNLRQSQSDVAAELLRSQAEIAEELRVFRSKSDVVVGKIKAGVGELLDHDADRDVPGLRYDTE